MFDSNNIFWMVILIVVVWLIYKIWKYVLNFIQFQKFHATIGHVICVLQMFREPYRGVKMDRLNLHVISKYPLTDVPPRWGLIFYHEIKHPLVKILKKINAVFIVETDEKFKQPFEFEVAHYEKNRVVTHDLKQMYYHMYYSSKEYKEPDAVLVYNDTATQLDKEDDDTQFHSDMSYRNMTAKQGAFLILLDESEQRLRDRIRALEKVRPDKNLRLLDYHQTPATNYCFTIIKRM